MALVGRGQPSSLPARLREYPCPIVFARLYGAQAGDPAGSAQLGNLYFLGSRGVTQDPAAAARLYRVAVEGGEASAMGILGAMTYAGVGVPNRDEREAVRLWRMVRALALRPGGRKQASGGSAGDTCAMCNEPKATVAGRR